MTITGHVTNGVIIPDDPDVLREGDVVSIRPIKSRTRQPRPRKLSPLAKVLLKHAGTIKGAPPDMARNHDHYAHGAPKQ